MQFPRVGVAFEHGDLGVFVLTRAGHDAERLVGKMPGQGAAELSGGERPGPVAVVRNEWFTVGAEQSVDVVAELVDPCSWGAYQGALVGEQVLRVVVDLGEDVYCLVYDVEYDPFGGLAV
jgi:hypothetical protein